MYFLEECHCSFPFTSICKCAFPKDFQHFFYFIHIINCIFSKDFHRVSPLRQCATVFSKVYLHFFSFHLQLYFFKGLSLFFLLYTCIQQGFKSIFIFCFDLQIIMNNISASNLEIFAYLIFLKKSML